jgi:hypothetical protein
MSEVLLVMSLLERARALGLACGRAEVQASRLVMLWGMVGECRAYRVAWAAYLRELACIGSHLKHIDNHILAT